ncbi:MAG: CCA tRNA nucleotidyltransferase [Deltaproteobacteria bacterium]|nr:CCA tRNA nucleotidyltransferase [Deltaproteobacteria bacterium]
MNIGGLLQRFSVLPVLRDAGMCAEGMGLSAYAVGGLVRDLFLRRETLDVDVVIEGNGLAFASRFAAGQGARLTLYKRFKTAHLVLPGDVKVDVATARTETYDRPAALPVVRPGSIRDDLFRRDFSINTLAACLNPGRFGDLFDPFGAMDDIRDGRIRVLHDGSFIDDPTRMFRAVRFEKRFDFRIEDATEILIRDAVSAGLVGKLSGYRIASELRLVLREGNPPSIVRRLEELGVLSLVRKEGKRYREVTRLLRRIDEEK